MQKLKVNKSYQKTVYFLWYENYRGVDVEQDSPNYYGLEQRTGMLSSYYKNLCFLNLEFSCNSTHCMCKCHLGTSTLLPWDLATRRRDTYTLMLMLVAMPLTIKSFCDPEVLCLLSNSMKLQQANLLTHNQVKPQTFHKLDSQLIIYFLKNFCLKSFA